MKNTLRTSLILICSFALGCANMTPGQQAIATTASNFARIAVEAAAAYYGGPAAGVLAAAGLDSLGKVVQAYVGETIPAAIVKASPGVQGVGTALVPLVDPNHIVVQADADKVVRAAEIARVLGSAVVTPATSP